MKGVIEGLLYVQGDLGLTLEQAASILDISVEAAKGLILSLKQEYTKWFIMPFEVISVTVLRTLFGGNIKGLSFSSFRNISPF